MPTITITSFPRGECVPGTTVLELGMPGRDRSNADSSDVYVARAGPELAECFAEPYRDDVELPAGALDIGYELEGRHLWLSKDRKRAYVGDVDSVELWLRTVQQLECVRGRSAMPVQSDHL